MIQTINEHTPSRRGLLGQSGLALLGAFTLGDVAQRIAAPPADLDRELLAICAEIVRLHEAVWVNCPQNMSFEEEGVWEVAKAPLDAQRLELIDRLAEMDTLTLAGMQARALVILKVASDLVQRPRDYVDQMIAALIRDLTGGVQA